MNVPDDLKKLADELDDRQRTFIELCFSTPSGNKSEAYMKAYDLPSSKRYYAGRQAGHILNDKAKPGTKKHVQQQYYKALQKYFAGLEDKESGERIMDAIEWMTLCTAICRGEVKDQFGLEPSLADRIKAMDLMGKALGVLKPQQTNVTITNNPYQKFTDEELRKIAEMADDSQEG